MRQEAEGTPDTPEADTPDRGSSKGPEPVEEANPVETE